MGLRLPPPAAILNKAHWRKFVANVYNRCRSN
jgi:hypothetical protein